MPTFVIVLSLVSFNAFSSKFILKLKEIFRLLVFALQKKQQKNLQTNHSYFNFSIVQSYFEHFTFTTKPNNAYENNTHFVCTISFSRAIQANLYRLLSDAHAHAHATHTSVRHY